MRTLLVAAVLAGCTLPAVMPEVRSTAFVPTGGLSLYNRSVTFDAVRVRGPNVNLSRRTDGSWAGVLDARAVDVTVTDTRIVGVDLLLTRAQSEPGRLVITGQFQGLIYRFELDDERVVIRGPSRSYDLPGRQLGGDQTTYGPQGNLVLQGQAGAERPPWPQLAFGLLSLMH